MVIEKVLEPEAFAELFEKTTSLIAASKSAYKTSAPVGLANFNFPATGSQVVVIEGCEAAFASSYLSNEPE